MNRLSILPILVLLGCTAPTPEPKSSPVNLINPLPKHSEMRRVVFQPRTPPYPAKARNSGLQGDTLVGLVVGADGIVTQVIPYSGDPILLAHTSDFVGLVKFEPNSPTQPDSPVILKIRYRIENGSGFIEIIFGSRLGA